ncbi:MAG: nodulation efficiency protein D [Campylobacterales bacterium]|nr:nodulation efficiency protein D [Campylobacterales bacterium]
MEAPILETFSAMLLIAMGIGLIALEALLFSFVVFWFGVATILVGFSSYFIEYNDGLWQLATIALIALLLLFTLRSKALERFMKSQDHEHNDNFFNTSGEGEVRNGKVYFKGTYWKIESQQLFSEGERVRVTSTEGSTAQVEKL